jgi:hypothetical protein
MRRPRILVTWFGSIAGHGTIGDLFAVQSVVARLVERGFDVSHASATSSAGLAAPNLAIAGADPDAFDVAVFVCGPILKGHPVLHEVLDRFAACRRIGVSVSLMPPTASNHILPFDLVLAREGATAAYEDVAILAPVSPPPLAPAGRQAPLRLGLTLRGRQAEYGADRCLHNEVADLAARVVARLEAGRRVEVVEIEHHLVRAGRRPEEIEQAYAGCDLVVTSRFHGGVLALRNNVPFIAIDQIAGGAKVSALLGDRGWPHVYRADSIDSAHLCDVAANLTTEPPSAAVEQTAARLRAGAERTLDALEAMLAG